MLCSMHYFSRAWTVSLSWLRLFKDLLDLAIFSIQLSLNVAHSLFELKLSCTDVE